MAVLTAVSMVVSSAGPKVDVRVALWAVLSVGWKEAVMVAQSGNEMVRT